MIGGERERVTGGTGATSSQPDPWVRGQPGLLRAWDATALRMFMQCPRRFQLRQIEGWRPRRTGAAGTNGDGGGESSQPGNVHLWFGTAWHACVEVFDKARLCGERPAQATERAVALALELSEAEGVPVFGEVMTLWRCTGVEGGAGGKRRRFLCDAARGEWVTGNGLDACLKCARPVVTRQALVPAHATKNRLNLLRAVLAYCDEQATSGLRPAMYGAQPALEISFALSLGRKCPDGRPYLLCGHLDRLSEFGGAGAGATFPHERKTTTRGLTRAYWDAYAVDPQIATYDLAAARLGLKHEGVIVETVQVMQGGVRLARQIFTRGPEQRDEWEREIGAILENAELCAWAGDWPRNTSACSSADGGQPCVFRGVCAQAPSQREQYLETHFERGPLWNPLEER